MLKTLTNSILKDPQKMNFAGEDNDEKILYVFRKANITNVRWIVSVIVLLIIPALFNVAGTFFSEYTPILIEGQLVFIVQAFWYIFTFGYGLEEFLKWFFNVHIITNKRIVDMDFSHIFNRNVAEAPLRNIEDITHVIEGPAQTLFNFGNIFIQTAAEERVLEFNEVSDPARIQDILSDLVSSIRGYYDRS